MKAKAVKIAEEVYWTGVLDWDIRNYHGYTLKGTTYNSYLVFSEDKAVLIDNTYPGTSSQMWGRIEDAFQREGREPKVDVIIQNHIEKDHSGSLLEIHKKFPEAPIYCTETAKKGLVRHFPALESADFRTVKTGDSLDLGNIQFAFLEAPMLHWPDSMFTLLVNDGILFSNDAFGQHLCFKDRLDTDIPKYLLMDAARKFYANLITPLSMLVVRKFEEIKNLELLDKINMIAPSHGQIWTDPMEIITAYSEWASGKRKNMATIIYDTMHFSTRTMAHALAEGLISEDINVNMYFIHEDERSEMVKDILESKALLIGVPTLFNEPYPSIGDMMYYLKGLSFDRTSVRRLAVTFGSKGWSGKAVDKLAESLEQCGFQVMDKYEVDYVPTEDELDKCYEIGQKLGAEMKKA